jgi:UDP-N-acetylmuramyl pentapeptide phosphotransferase/UDP-N-acetylglucosamine-1-phosphate transferase
MAAWLLIHFAIAVAGTWLARRYALSRQLIDQPGERRSHQVPTPRGGGIAIVLALLVASAALSFALIRMMAEDARGNGRRKGEGRKGKRRS